MKKVTGIGGVFFKSKNPAQTNEWYKTHLGLPVTPYGASFEWRSNENPDETGLTHWSTFEENSDCFAPSTKDFMINYRVENIEALVTQLKLEGVTILDEIASYDYGKFVHILDPEGNKIELWEPS